MESPAATTSCRDSSSQKVHVPWYVKTEGCEMVKGVCKGSSDGKRRADVNRSIKQEIISNSNVNHNHDLIDVGEAEGKDDNEDNEDNANNDTILTKRNITSRRVDGRQKSSGTPTLTPTSCKKPKKILQHLDMQG